MRKSGVRVPGSGFWLCGALFLLAFFTRCIGLQWGLPSSAHWYSYHPDEYQMFSAVMSLNFFNGDFNPDFFNYPSLYIYLAYFSHGLMGVLGLAHPLPQNQSQLWMLMRDVLLSARLVTAVLGAATVPLVFLIARKIGGWKIGVLAALLFTFAPGHVQHSHFATVDVPTTFFVTLCLWLSTRALRTDAEAKWRVKQLLFAAFVAGLATATKYNGVLVIVAPLAAWFFLTKQNTVSRVLPFGLIGLCALGFFIGCPFSVFDFPHFWGNSQNSGFAYELLVHPKQGHGEVFLETGNGWLYHFFFNAPFLLGLPLLLTSLFGMASTRLKPRRETSVLLIWCALYFFALGFSHVRFMRYLLPLVPALCVFAACGVLTLRARNLKIISSAALVFITTWGARDVLYPFFVEDSRDRAADFLRYSVSSSVKVSASVGMAEPPWFFSPPLSPLDSPPFRRLSPSQLSQLSGGKYSFAFTDFDAEKLQREKPQYFILSEFEWREKARLHAADYTSFKQALEREYSLAVTFKNQPPLALPGRDFVPHDFLYTNPEIKIYRRR